MKNLKKTYSFLLIGCFLFITNQLMAVPAKPDPVNIKQPDGTEITVIVRGDERINWTETTDGYTLMRDSQQYLVYATKDAEGNLTPSNIKYFGTQTAKRVQGVQQFLTTLPKGLFYSKAQVNTLRQIWEITDTKPQTNAPVTGNKKNLCILMEYPDLRMTNS